MNESIDALIQELADPATRAGARRQLLDRGPSARTAIRAALRRELTAAQQAELLDLLRQIGGPEDAELFRKFLDSEQSQVRSAAAAGLQQQSAADAVAALVATLNDAPDLLHTDLTPSVLALSELGLPAVHAILPLLSATEARTRQRAQRVLERVTFARVDRATGIHPHVENARRAWQALWEANGSYRWDAPEPERLASQRLWQDWLMGETRT